MAIPYGPANSLLPGATQSPSRCTTALRVRVGVSPPTLLLRARLVCALGHELPDRRRSTATSPRRGREGSDS